MIKRAFDMVSPLFYSFLWSGIAGWWLRECSITRWGSLAYKKQL